jgi:hypothetical protein
MREVEGLPNILGEKQENIFAKYSKKESINNVVVIKTDN